MNYHKRCVIKVPNNCSHDASQRRRSSAMLNVPRSPSQGSTSSLTSISDDNHSTNNTPNASQNNSTLVRFYVRCSIYNLYIFAYIIVFSPYYKFRQYQV